MGETTYETPQYLYDRLNEAYGPFDLDAAADIRTKKCFHYLNKQDNALDWNPSWPSRFTNPEVINKVYLNPPWGPKDPVFPWVRKAVREIHIPSLKERMFFKNHKAYYRKLTSNIDTICMLLPWGRWASWHEFIVYKAEMVRVIGRVPFLLNGKPVKSPPACNVVAILRRPTKGHRWPVGFTGATIDGRN